MGLLAGRVDRTFGINWDGYLFICPLIPWVGQRGVGAMVAGRSDKIEPGSVDQSCLTGFSSVAKIGEASAPTV